ncbi:MAG: DUF763 domain-containing protein [Spirochaetales bacterium]|nr:DUF763 domain-containing protein [Spirochaetales bacterium]
MPRNTGHADLPLHTGIVPRWLADRMRDMGTLIVEALIIQYGKKEVLRRLSDPLWFQSLGAVLGMDWHSSGITTSVMYALKRGINARARDFGLVVCGGRGKYSRRTPEELEFVSNMAGLDGDGLVRNSKLVAKVDSTAVQDGFQLYQHNFIVSDEGDWTVVQQGMNAETKTARRYHWCSENLKSFVEEPHTGITGENQKYILNLTDTEAKDTRSSILSISKENPDKIIKEMKDIQTLGKPEFLQPVVSRNIVMPAHHDVRAEDVDLKRLGSVLATAYESDPKDFESLLLTPGLGPRTLQSLTLVSEVINGTPSRFRDPARFSFAHGGKDGHPFPVPLRIYDESIRILGDAIERSRLGYKEKSECINRLHKTQLEIEKNCDPRADFEAVLEHERLNLPGWEGRTETEKYYRG